jgi:hypothetical protein
MVIFHSYVSLPEGTFLKSECPKTKVFWSQLQSMLGGHCCWHVQGSRNRQVCYCANNLVIFNHYSHYGWVSKLNWLSFYGTPELIMTMGKRCDSFRHYMI